MSTTQELRKPVFVKVKDLEKVKSGYNVYVKVISIQTKEVETRDGQKIQMVDALVGDETAVAKAFFKGQNAIHIQKGNVIAIRNGLKKFIKNFISLELDIFGRITKESLDINVDQTYNISEHQHKLPERGPRGPRNFQQGRRQNRRPNNGPRRNNDRPRNNEDRPPRRQFEDRPPRRNNQDRPPRRNNQDRPPRRNNEDRPPRRNNEDRPERYGRQERFERNQRRDDRNERAPRRENNNRSYDRDFDRRRENNDNRPPRREQQRYEPRREEFRERAPINWTKIEEISPADERLNLIVKVLAEEIVNGRNRNMLRCTLGDETGTVRAFLQDTPALRVGKSVVLFDCEARVVKEHIEIQCRGRIEAARRDVERVNEKFNLSEKSWVPVNQ